MYEAVLPIYWDEIGPTSFNFKNKNNHKALFKYQTERHLFCDDMDIYNVNIELYKLICEIKMSVQPLYSKEITFSSHLHTYITGNHEPRLKAERGLMRRELLVQTSNIFYSNKEYDKIPVNNLQNAKMSNPYLFRDSDNVEDKIAWIQLHLKHTMEMYANND